MFFNRFAIFLFIISFSVEISAQRLITGKVLDLNTKLPVENVDVTIYKRTITTSTNRLGYFQLTVAEDDSLLITHKEYKPGLIALPKVDVFSVFVERYHDYPVYLSGEASLFEYLRKNLKYPVGARLKGVEGTVFIELLVNAAGEIAGCKCLNEIRGNCGQKAIPVFQKIPGKWSPSQELKRFIFPVVFRNKFDDKPIEMPKVDLPEGKLMRVMIIYAFPN